MGVHLVQKVLPVPDGQRAAFFTNQGSLYGAAKQNIYHLLLFFILMEPNYLEALGN